MLPYSGAGLFLAHELFKRNPVPDRDPVAFFNINPDNQSGDDHMPDLILSISGPLMRYDVHLSFPQSQFVDRCIIHDFSGAKDITYT